jgi:hypothetical protein
MSRLSVCLAGLVIAMLVNELMMRRNWSTALRAVVCFFIGVAVMRGYRWAERRG